MKKTSNSNAQPHYVYKYPPKVSADNIVRAILSGVDIVFIDPKLFSYILPSIQYFKGVYEKQGEVKFAKELEYLEKYTSNYKRRKEIADSIEEKMPPRRIKVEPIVYSDEEIEEEIDYLMENDITKAYSADQVKVLVKAMRARREEYVAEREYIDADRIGVIINKLMEVGDLSEVASIQVEKVRDLKSKISEAENELEESKIKWDKIFENMQNVARNEVSQLAQELEEELQKVEEKRKEGPPPSIRKYSNILLDYRAKEKAMVRMKNYDGAAEMRDKADIMQSEENHAFIIRWNKKLDRKALAIRKKYDEKLNSRIQFWKTEESSMVKDANEEIAKGEKAIENMKENLKTMQYQKRITKSALNKTKETKLKTVNMNERQTPLQHRQRAILNKRIYTMTPRKRSESSQLPSYRRK